MEPLPDSAEYIATLERKLQKIQAKNASTKVNGKQIIASMSEFKEIYMRDAFKNNLNLNPENDMNDESAVVDISYLQRKITPIQQVNTEEAKCLIESDWLAESRKPEQEETETETQSKQ